jgi:hypothetical protein
MVISWDYSGKAAEQSGTCGTDRMPQTTRRELSIPSIGMRTSSECCWRMLFSLLAFRQMKEPRA